MARIRAVIFDADGTLLDTREFILRAFEHVLSTSGYALPRREVIAATVGRSLTECYEILVPGGDAEALRDMHIAFQQDNFHLIDSYEGVILTLDTLRQNKMKIGILSTRLGTLVATLEHVGIRDHCDAIVGGKDVKNVKPDPEGLFKILRMLDADASHAAMIGDTVQDIGAGKNAGVALTIGVTHGFGKRDALEEAGADHIVDRIPDITPILLRH